MPNMPDRSLASSLTTRLGWLTLFAAAFGYLEAAVVVYLRALFYPDGFAFPLVLLDDRIALVEVGRELCTLLMLLGAAGLAAASAWGRFGAFAFVFGVWDLVFYAGLKAMLGWPESLATWDVLFLIPGVWTGPVWTAAVIALLLVLCGAWIMRADAAGQRPRPGGAVWAAGAVALLLLLAAVLWNHGPATRGEAPAWFPWPLWLAGVVIALVAFARLFGPQAWRGAAAGR
jgi:hypothetical protein